MISLAARSANQLRHMLDRRECSSTEIVASCFERIHRIEGRVKAFVDLDEEEARRQAELCDRSPVKGPLHGIPVSIKDTVDVKDMLCTWGTPIHARRRGARDALVVKRLREAGAIVVGTTVTTEYAIAKAGPTTNPHNPAYSPGGSSSGSGASVAARMVSLSVATQSVGSIIRPASYCGVYGMKPTIGTMSTDGMMALSPYLDHVGPMARSVDDIALAMRIMLDEPASHGTGSANDWSAPLPENATCLRIDGPYSERIESPTAEALTRAQRALENAGVKVTSVELPKRFSSLIECYETIIFKDLTERHKVDWQTNPELVSPALFRIMETGLSIKPSAYENALQDAAYFHGYLTEQMKQAAVILTPATDGSAPVMSDRTGEQKLQSLWTVTGMPSLGTPCGKVSGLPVGVQLVSSRHRDDLCLSAGRILHREYGEDNLVVDQC